MPAHWGLLRDVAVFQLKLLLDGVRDLLVGAPRNGLDRGERRDDLLLRRRPTPVLAGPYLERQVAKGARHRQRAILSVSHGHAPSHGVEGAAYAFDPLHLFRKQRAATLVWTADFGGVIAR